MHTFLFDIRLWLVGYLLVWAGLIHGHEVVEPTKVETELAYMEAPAESGLVDVLSRPVSNWQAVDVLSNFGFRKEAFWIRLVVRNISDTSLYQVARMEYGAHDFVTVYQLNDQNEIAKQWVLGDRVDHIQRPIEDKHAAFPVKLAAGAEQIFFIRVQSVNALILGIDVMDASQHGQVLQITWLLAGLIYGILLVMAFYNFGLAVFIKDKAYAVYVVYVLSFLLFVLVLSGDGYYFLWSDSPELNAYALPFSAAWLMVPSLLFPYFLLDLKHHLRPVARLIQAMVVMVFLFIICIPFLALSDSIKLINFISAITAFGMLIVGAYLTYLKVPIAGIYTFAWFILLVGLTILPLSSLGYIDNNVFTRNANFIGGVLETVILSLALAQRVRQEKEARMHALNESVHAQQEASRNKQLFEGLFHNSPVGIFQAKKSGDILAVNPALVELLGYESEGEIKRKPFDVYRQFDGARELGRKIFKVGEIVDYESRFTPTQGEPIPCSITLRAGKIADEPIVEGFVTDIRERKNTQKIHELMEHERIQSIDHLVTGVAHEMNTPLGNNITSISHIKELLNDVQTDMERGELSRKGFEAFVEDGYALMDIMDNNLQRMSGLVSRFKQLSIAKMDIEQVPVNMYEYFHEVLASQFQLDGSVKTHIECDQNIVLSTYPAAWKMILDQLIDNSVTHGFDATQSEKWLHVQLSKIDGEHWCFRYMDNGKGMDADTLAKIFEPFFTTRRSHEKHAGLGMYRVYNLVTQVLKAEIEVESHSGFALQIEFKAAS